MRAGESSNTAKHTWGALEEEKLKHTRRLLMNYKWTPIQEMDNVSKCDFSTA